MRRELRKLVDDAEADILRNCARKWKLVEAWADSPARREQLAFARRNRDDAVKKYDLRLKRLWLELNESFLAEQVDRTAPVLLRTVKSRPLCERR